MDAPSINLGPHAVKSIREGKKVVNEWNRQYWDSIKYFDAIQYMDQQSIENIGEMLSKIKDAEKEYDEYDESMKKKVY